MTLQSHIRGLPTATLKSKFKFIDNFRSSYPTGILNPQETEFKAMDLHWHCYSKIVALIFSIQELDKKVRAAGIRTQHNEAVCYFKDTSEPNLALGSELRLGLFPYKFLLVTPWYQELRLV